MKLVTLDGKMNQDEIIVDNFAGGGGASTGIELAIGRSVDVAINHDPDAIAMHTANHPNTKHYCEDVFDIDPQEVTQGRKVALCWLSPDCKHFSKAKGGKPVDKKIRGLAWIAVRWAVKVRPRVIILENVEEFKSWGPLKDNRPDPERKGQTFSIFVKQLEKEGYKVEWRELKACDFGAPTTRKRFFMIARCDGQEIVWPQPNYGQRNSLEVEQGLLKPYKSAAEIIDWSVPGKSIFGRKKPLVENTLKRIGRGLKKFVIDSPDPFIVRIGQTGFGKDRLQYSLSDSLTTITSKAEHCLVTPYVAVNTTGHSGSDINDPLKTITTGGHHMLIEPHLVEAVPFLSKYYGGNYNGSGIELSDPTDTITSVDHHSLVTAFISKCYGGQNRSTSSDIKDCLHTVTARNVHSLVKVKLSSEEVPKDEIEEFLEKYCDGTPILGEKNSHTNSAFLVKYYGNDTGQSINEPVHTIPTRDRFGLIQIKGVEYKIVDITLRMLLPRELFNAMGFPGNYIIDRDQFGKKIPKDKQVARCGNAVSPPTPKALVKSNLPELCKGGAFVEQVDLFKVGY